MSYILRRNDFFSIFVVDKKFPDPCREDNEILRSQFPENYCKTTQLPSLPTHVCVSNFLTLSWTRGKFNFICAIISGSSPPTFIHITTLLEQREHKTANERILSPELVFEIICFFVVCQHEAAKQKHRSCEKLSGAHWIYLSKAVLIIPFISTHNSFLFLLGEHTEQ